MKKLLALTFVALLVVFVHAEGKAERSKATKL